MQVSSKETRRSFVWQFATWSAVAGGSGLGATPIFAAEPESCAGPKPPATAIPWKPDTNPVLPRPAASTLTDAEVTRLRHAYQALRDLTVSQPDDPRGWLEQADKHLLELRRRSRPASRRRNPRQLALPAVASGIVVLPRTNPRRAH